MILYYKSINKGDYKELNIQKKYDINSIIIKIVSDFDIEEVEFDDEVFVNRENSKEIILHKLRTNTKDYISFSIRYKQNIHVKVKKLKLNLSENSKVYEIDQITTLDEMYNITKNIAKNGFNDKFLSIYTSDLDKEFNSNEYREKLKLLSSMLKMIIEISKDLKVELIREEELRDSSEVKIVSATSAKYFIVHSEDWYREGNLMPKPIRLLIDIYLENKDIYENKFIRLVIFRCIIFIKSEILKLQNFLNVYKPELERKYSEIELEGVDVGTIRSTINILKRNIEDVDNLKDKFVSLKNKLIIVEKKFLEVKLMKNLPLKMTQKMSYDNRYKITYKAYKELKDKFYDEAIYNKLRSTEKTYYKYLAIVMNAMIDAFSELQFTDIIIEGIGTNEVSLFKNGVAVINGSTPLGNYSFEIKINELENDNKFALELILSDQGGNSKEFKFNINMGYDFSSKEKLQENISVLYMKNEKEDNIITVILESFESLNSDFIESEEFFKLANVGNNFISNSDYEIFGDYKKGVILFSLSDYVISKNKFKNLFLDNLAKLSYGDFCFKCSSNRLEQIDEELYLCKSCGSRVAINKCECGEKIVKVLSKEKEDIEEEVNILDKMLYHNKYDLQSNYLGSCYGNLHSNTGGFCAACGKCLKKTKGDCLRCGLLNK